MADLRNVVAGDPSPDGAGHLRIARGIEVGQIFYFGTQYSDPMKAHVVNDKGERVPVHMGSHGIGVSRLLGAIIEASHDDKGIIWPEGVTPFHCGIVNLKQGDSAADAACESLYAALTKAGLTTRILTPRKTDPTLWPALAEMTSGQVLLVLSQSGDTLTVYDVTCRDNRTEVPLAEFLPVFAGTVLRAGWPTIRGALAMRHMMWGYRRGLIRFGVFCGIKG